MRHHGLLAVLAATLVALAVAVTSTVEAQLTNLSGTWHTAWTDVPGRGGGGGLDIEANHRNGGIIWTYGAGHTMTCALEGTRCVGAWVGSSGSGWFDITFTSDGRTFNGTWGYGGNHAAVGAFSGGR